MKMTIYISTLIIPISYLLFDTVLFITHHFLTLINDVCYHQCKIRNVHKKRAFDRRILRPANTAFTINISNLNILINMPSEVSARERRKEPCILAKFVCVRVCERVGNSARERETPPDEYYWPEAKHPWDLFKIINSVVIITIIKIVF